MTSNSPVHRARHGMPRCAPAFVVAMLIVLAAVPAAAQTDGAALMREGNTLFRSGLYSEALLRYREANAAGLDSGLLQYNLGVTYYKLAQYPEAELWLERASHEATLAPLAAYNLGLTYRAAGDAAAAERWLGVAAASAGDAELRALARRAAATPRARQPDASTRAPRSTTRDRREPPVGELRLLANAAYGQVDNPNRSPAEPYVDLAQPGRPLVTPVPITATSMPVNLLAEYVLHNEAGDSDFVFGYRLDGDYYSKSELAHSEFTQELRMGADLDLGARANRKRTFEPALFVIRHNQGNFDLDSGADRDIEDFDVSSRFVYTSAGLEAEFAHTLGAWRWGFDMRAERRDYERTPILASYDQELYRVGASISYEINDATAVSFGMHSSRTLYDERSSRDLDGDLLSDNDPLEYGYAGVELTATRRLFDALELELKYLRLDRTDVFLGYNDYTRDIVGLHAVYRPHRRFLLSLGATSEVYDYPNAFAFNEPAAGPKELEASETELLAEFQITSTLAVSVELATTDVTSTDARAEYSRTQTVVGVTWRR
jgi:tetratricopeptide (TPR) repeat protein